MYQLLEEARVQTHPKKCPQHHHFIYFFASPPLQTVSKLFFRIYKGKILKNELMFTETKDKIRRVLPPLGPPKLFPHLVTLTVLSLTEEYSVQTINKIQLIAMQKSPFPTKEEDMNGPTFFWLFEHPLNFHKKPDSFFFPQKKLNCICGSIG